MTTKRYTWPGLVSTPVDSVKTNNVAPTERRPPRPDYAAPTPNVPPLPAPREPATVFDLLEWAAQCATTADDAATVRRCGKSCGRVKRTARNTSACWNTKQWLSAKNRSAKRGRSDMPSSFDKLKHHSISPQCSAA
jgi:hypothetical protein